ncbi:C6 transcription factor [Colletotrichum tofieldiae]|nr:C6 transcription factor [Colletotrichum tofieldiae]GKT70217.1 C6 transcription factor [Colletotrichum tofieldiae]GKT93267.1 C6 transcription factor [Colletotrichum tofieldiae]
MRKFAAWRVIEALCDQAMLYHKQRPHEGAWYAQRLDKAQGATTAQGKTPMYLENATVDDILGDVQMFGQDASQNGGIGGPNYFATQQALGTIGYPDWGQPTHPHGPSPSHPHQSPGDSDDI